MAAGNVGFGDDPLAPGCYSQLLFAEENSGLETDGLFDFTSPFSSEDNTPKMLCFGDYAKQYNENGKKTGRKPGISCMQASSSSKNVNVGNHLSISIHFSHSRIRPFHVLFFAEQEKRVGHSEPERM